MAEIEYGGIKIGGSKLLLIVPLVGTIIGGLWGGFELYSRYLDICLLYTSPSPRDRTRSRMPSSA